MCVKLLNWQVDLDSQWDQFHKPLHHLWFLLETGRCSLHAWDWELQWWVFSIAVMTVFLHEFSHCFAPCNNKGEQNRYWVRQRVQQSPHQDGHFYQTTISDRVEPATSIHLRALVVVLQGRFDTDNGWTEFNIDISQSFCLWLAAHA